MSQKLPSDAPSSHRPAPPPAPPAGSVAQIMVDLAVLESVNRALQLLVECNLITHSERLRLTRKYMTDRPEFKKAVEDALTQAGAANE